MDIDLYSSAINPGIITLISLMPEVVLHNLILEYCIGDSHAQERPQKRSGNLQSNQPNIYFSEAIWKMPLLFSTHRVQH